MPKGFESYKNGLIFGLLFGVLLLYASINISALGFVNSAMNSLVDWLTTQSWFPASLNVSWLNYGLAALIGAIVGIWIDTR